MLRDVTEDQFARRHQECSALYEQVVQTPDSTMTELPGWDGAAAPCHRHTRGAPAVNEGLQAVRMINGLTSCHVIHFIWVCLQFKRGRPLKTWPRTRKNHLKVSTEHAGQAAIRFGSHRSCEDTMHLGLCRFEHVKLCSFCAMLAPQHVAWNCISSVLSLCIPHMLIYLFSSLFLSALNL